MVEKGNTKENQKKNDVRKTPTKMETMRKNNYPQPTPKKAATTNLQSNKDIPSAATKPPTKPHAAPIKAKPVLYITSHTNGDGGESSKRTKGIFLSYFLYFSRLIN